MRDDGRMEDFVQVFRPHPFAIFRMRQVISNVLKDTCQVYDQQPVSFHWLCGRFTPRATTIPPRKLFLN